MTPTVHVVGGGVAGLAAALGCAETGLRPIVYEAAPMLGGRCRSFWDARLSMRIDNGNHLVMGGNRAVLRLLERVGASGELVGPEAPAYPFVDLEHGRRFVVRPRGGWRALRTGVPGARAWDVVEGARVALAGEALTVAQALRQRGALWRAFWEPLTVAALNTGPERGQARLLWRVLAGTFLKGGAAARPLVARVALADALVDPVAGRVRGLGGEVRTGARVMALERECARVAALRVGAERVVLGPRDLVVIAAPPSGARRLLPELVTPDDGAAIVNAHFRLAAPPPPLPGGAMALGMLGAAGQWLFVRGEHVAVTISAAAGAPGGEEALLERLWEEVRVALRLGAGARFEAGRIITEKRATFDATPEGARRRPGRDVGLANLALAGDWTATGLPATLESATVSGDQAAQLVRARVGVL